MFTVFKTTLFKFTNKNFLWIKFINRFNKIEELILRDKKKISDYSTEELDRFWKRVKD